MGGSGYTDLRSDTVTRPSAAMRKAMAGADVGDDLFGDDPTVLQLQERAAGLTRKQAALYLPTGTPVTVHALKMRAPSRYSGTPRPAQTAAISASAPTGITVPPPTWWVFSTVTRPTTAGS